MCALEAEREEEISHFPLITLHITAAVRRILLVYRCGTCFKLESG